MPFDSTSRPTEAQVMELVVGLQILDDPILTKPIPANRKDGLYALFRRYITLSAYGFDKFLRAYLAKFPPDNPQQRDRLRRGLESSLLRAFDEPVTNMHARVMMLGLAGHPVSLTTVTKELCDESDQNFSRVRSRVRKKYLNALHDLLIWDVDEKHRPHRNGTGETSYFEIKVGEAARHYHKLVFVPLMLNHLSRFVSDFDDSKGA